MTVFFICLIIFPQIHAHTFKRAPPIAWMATDGRVVTETKVYQITLDVKSLCDAWDQPMMRNENEFIRRQRMAFKNRCLTLIESAVIPKIQEYDHLFNNVVHEKNVRDQCSKRQL